MSKVIIDCIHIKMTLKMIECILFMNLKYVWFLILIDILNLLILIDILKSININNYGIYNVR